MKKYAFGMFAALCLCLTLLPAAAQAAGTVEIGGVTLVSGNAYKKDGGSLVVASDPLPADYLEYTDGTLKVHGDSDLSFFTAPTVISGSVTITGESGSNLAVREITLSSGSTLTLDGSVRLCSGTGASGEGIQGTGGTPYPLLTTTADYDGVIQLQGTNAVKDVALNIQNSTGILIDSVIQYTNDKPDSTTLISTSGITIDCGNHPCDLPNLTVQSGTVSITGESGSGNPFFPGPVTFENCGTVSITDTSSGPLLGENGRVTTNCLCTVTRPSGTDTVIVPGYPTSQWQLGTLGSYDTTVNGTTPTAYEAGDGWILFEPNPLKVTLDNAFYNGWLKIRSPAELELVGENEIYSIECQDLTLTGTGSFTGFIFLNGSLTQNSVTLNAIVRTSDAYSVYGNASNAGLALEGTSSTPFKIMEGATLTIVDRYVLAITDAGGLVNNGTLVNNGILRFDLTSQDLQDPPDFGKIINNNVIRLKLPADAAGEQIPALVKSLGLTGGGTVNVVDSGNQTIATYTNSGVKQLASAGTLNLSAAPADDTHWDDLGYKWEPVFHADGDIIISGTLTLAAGFNAETVVLPGNGANVTVNTQGDSRIETLDYAGNTTSTSIYLTFVGGKLTIAQPVNFSGGNDSSVTVAAGAVVEADGGISVATSGGIDGTITVNGTLKATNDAPPPPAAVVTGKISVGPSGHLEVYGNTGVLLGGIYDADSDSADFIGAFRLAPGGRFTGNCATSIIFAQKHTGAPFEDSLRKEDVISIPDGYLPPELERGFDFYTGRTELRIPGGGPFDISKNRVPPTPVIPGGPGEPGGPAEPSGPSGGYDGDDGGSGSVGKGRPGYAVTVEPSDSGKVISSRRSAFQDDTVTLTVIPDEGYALDSLSVTDSRGDAVELREENGKYVFTMPGRAVTVRAVFSARTCGGGEDCPSRNFTDLGGPGTWYHEAVDHVLRAGVMGGYGNGLFRPDAPLTRAQFVQILYNLEGRPSVAADGIFSDVTSGAWCAGAVAWAARRGVTGGYEDGRFRPDSGITREQLAVMLWRYAGTPSARQEPGFSDMDSAGAYALEALRWAAEAGVMGGRTGGVLDPKGPATRAQAAQMLWNFMTR